MRKHLKLIPIFYALVVMLLSVSVSRIWAKSPKTAKIVFTPTRDRLIHHYFGVDIEVVWKISTAELSDLTLQIAKILGSDSTVNEDNSA